MTKRKQNKPVIGVVGGVGAGKSTAAAAFAALGCALIDADEFGHEALEEPGVKARLRRRWGDKVLTADGSVDRGKVAKIVFADPAELEALTRITWPRIGRKIDRAIARAQADPNVAASVLDAAVLFEAGWDARCTHVVYVDAPDDVRKRRARRKGLREASWRRREKSQISLDSKKRQCYAQIDNSSSVPYLREQVRQVLSRITQRRTDPDF